MHFKSLLPSLLLAVLFSFNLADATAQYAETDIALEQGETLNTDIFGYGGLLLTLSVIGFFAYAKLNNRKQSRKSLE